MWSAPFVTIADVEIVPYLPWETDLVTFDPACSRAAGIMSEIIKMLVTEARTQHLHIIRNMATSLK
jgi:hypothetical protein